MKNKVDKNDNSMKKLKVFTKIISIFLIAYLLLDLIVFRINTMPRLTQINHEDFIKEVDNIKNLSTAKLELKKWINIRYNTVYQQNKIDVKYLCIIGFLFLINIFDIVFNYKENAKSK